MKKYIQAFIVSASFLLAYSQTLLVPGGTSGIGSSSNGNVGINDFDEMQVAGSCVSKSLSFGSTIDSRKLALCDVSGSNLIII